MSVPELNRQVAAQLELLAQQATGDDYRARAFHKAAQAIGSHPGHFRSGLEARQQLPAAGIGTSIQAIIDEIVARGVTSRLSPARPRPQTPAVAPGPESGVPPEQQAFERIYDIGKIRAREFYQAGYRTLTQLLHSGTLTRAQRLGVIWFEDIETPIPRAEIDQFGSLIGAILNPRGLRWTFGGSYARQAPSSGDIDLLVVLPEAGGLDMTGLILLLSPLLVARLSMATVDFKGIARLPGSGHLGRRMDVGLVPADRLPFSLLHSTGSGTFNELLRHRAKELGFKLSQKGLFRRDDGSPVPGRFETDRDIFDFLGVKYLAPSERLKTLTGLEYV